MLKTKKQEIKTLVDEYNELNGKFNKADDFYFEHKNYAKEFPHHALEHETKCSGFLRRMQEIREVLEKELKRPLMSVELDDKGFIVPEIQPLQITLF